MLVSGQQTLWNGTCFSFPVSKHTHTHTHLVHLPVPAIITLVIITTGRTNIILKGCLCRDKIKISLLFVLFVFLVFFFVGVGGYFSRSWPLTALVFATSSPSFCGVTVHVLERQLGSLYCCDNMNPYGHNCFSCCDFNLATMVSLTLAGCHKEQQTSVQIHPSFIRAWIISLDACNCGRWGCVLCRQVNKFLS